MYNERDSSILVYNRSSRGRQGSNWPGVKAWQTQGAVEGQDLLKAEETLDVSRDRVEGFVQMRANRYRT